MIYTTIYILPSALWCWKECWHLVLLCRANLLMVFGVSKRLLEGRGWCGVLAEVGRQFWLQLQTTKRGFGGQKHSLKCQCDREAVTTWQSPPLLQTLHPLLLDNFRGKRHHFPGKSDCWQIILSSWKLKINK